ncbi:MAG: hypothetical protein ACYC5Y_05015 [Symbiobacteriia bacterium]
MATVIERPTVTASSSREEALATDVHYAERRAVLAEKKAAEAIRRYHAARRNMETYRAAMAGTENELIAIRLRERELEAQNGLLLRLLARAAPGLRRHETPKTPNNAPYLVIRTQRPQSHWVGQAGKLVGVREERHITLLTLQFDEDHREDFLPAELTAL